jgi:hypothetical protein
MNNDWFRGYNQWLQQNLHGKNIKIVEPISLADDNIENILLDPSIMPDNVPEHLQCPWCSEYRSVKNLTKNTNKSALNIPFNDYTEHINICPHKIHHINIEKNMAQTLKQTFKILSDMIMNFEALTTNYELLKQQNEELTMTKNTIKQQNEDLIMTNSTLTLANNSLTLANNTLNDITKRFNRLKNKYDSLKETNNMKLKELLKDNQTKYDELFKASLLKNSKSDEKVNLTINGGGNNINLLTYIGDNCKNAEPINAVDNNRKIAMNKLLITKGITETPKIVEITSSMPHQVTLESSSPPVSLIPKTPNISDAQLPKMFIDGFINNENSYHVFIADILVKYFKKEDVTKQPMWSTDTSRCSYIIKILPDDWIKDKSGVTLLNKCIEPFINYIDDVIRKYSESLEDKEIKIQNKFMEETKKAYIKKFKGKQLEKFDFTCIESCMVCNEELYNFAANKSLGLDIKSINTEQTKLGEILVCINKEGFSKKVIKEITPYFASDRLKLNSLPTITDATTKLENIKPLNKSSLV